jgi:hypothetical protein
MTKAQQEPRKNLDEIATSIRKLVLELENREIDGRPMTATEIQAIAGRLRGHVEDLLAASRSVETTHK